MSLGVCRTELLAERRDARITLCKLGLLGCDLGLLGCQRLGLLFEAGFLLGDELLETIELGGIGSGSDLRNGSRKGMRIVIDMYSRGKRKFACLTFELNSTT